MEKLRYNSGKNLLAEPRIKGLFFQLYGESENIFQQQIHRYKQTINQFKKYFSNTEVHLFSTPGRTEIGGNHTDHNAGLVLAAAVNLDSIAVAQVTEDEIITVHSEGYASPFIVLLDDLEPKKDEEETTTALIRGIAAQLNNLGYTIGGFNACISSDVMVGSGLSSSASIEVLIGTIFNTLYNAGKIHKEVIAGVGQYAENVYFNKPCGLMDQLTCVTGGIVSIDFKEVEHPEVCKVNFDFSDQDYSLLVVNTRGSHADLTDDYASIPIEMKAVAKALDGHVCRDITLQKVLPNIKALRTKVGDRAILRAMHYISENKRVLKQVEALENGDFETFLNLVSESGNSSFKWLQNCYTSKDPTSQGIALALALTENYFNDEIKGACRVHGGGFAGTIQVFMPNKKVPDYVSLMESVFGNRSVEVLIIRPQGTMYLGSFKKNG